MPLPVLEPNFNDTQWLSRDRLRVISPLCLPGLGTCINAAVDWPEIEVFLLANDYCLNTKFRTQRLSKLVLSLGGK